jgi:4-amino-4-deoxy-L-arabinose transferase-like glycosyltransferase
MAATGDWVTPRLYGQPWFEKPVLYYWAGAIGFLLHLSAEWALRLPSALAALAAAFAIGWLAWKHYAGGATRLKDPAVLAPLLFSTTVAAIGFSRAATPDMLFSASIALAMASAATVFRYAGRLRAGAGATTNLKPVDRLPLLMFGVFLGLGVLAKGPAAILLAGGAVALWTLCTGNWRASLRLAHPYAILSFGVIALPWYLLCALRNPDFIDHAPGAFALDSAAVAREPRRPSPLARKILARFTGILLRVLGHLPRAVFQFFAVETSQLYSSRRPLSGLARHSRANPLDRLVFAWKCDRRHLGCAQRGGA